MNREDMKRELRLFLSRELKHGAALASDEPLFELGFDSRAITELVFFVEASFGVTFSEEEQEEAEHFEDVNTIAALVQRKLGAT